jgi:signal-transduction protein with cAMP-binding, CBS, and nucleotidyltransferase domain
MAESNTGSLVVTAAGEVVGLFTERDLISRVIGVGKEVSSVTLGDVCTRNLFSIASDRKCEDAIRKMQRNNCRRLVVYRGNRFLGLVNLQDVANALAEKSKGKNLLINCISGVTLAAAIAMIALLLYNLPKMLQLANALSP